jgi:hypothetical protein
MKKDDSDSDEKTSPVLSKYSRRNDKEDSDSSKESESKKTTK